MKLTGTQRIEASRAIVWAALNDTETLRRCVPGCETLDRLSATEMTAKILLKIGPVKASFVGRVELRDLEPPVSYTIAGKGSGGVAGSAEGGARVRLQEDDGSTLLVYEIEARIAGKLAQLGGRLIDATARHLAGEFFARLGASLAATDTSEAVSR